MKQRTLGWVMRTLTIALLLAASPLRSATAQQVDTTLWTRLHYRFVGPEGNRAIAVVGEPGNPLVAYVGAASGGVWKTEDGGVHWRAVFDSEPAQAIGALGAQRRVGGHGRDLLHPVDDRARQRGLPLNRWWPELAAHGPRFDRAHRPHRDPSRESRRGARLRARPRLRPRATARRLPHRGRWQDLEPRAVRGREYRMLGPRDRSRRSQHPVRRNVAVRSEDLAPAERRAGERALGIARRRCHVEAPGWSRTARRQARRRQSRRGGRALEPQHRVRARRGPRPDALPQR